MDAIINQFLSFYGMALAPYTIALISSDSQDLLVLLEIITQLECGHLTTSWDCSELLERTPEEIKEHVSDELWRLCDRYISLFHEFPSYADRPDSFFESSDVSLEESIPRFLIMFSRPAMF
jgi:hypothetical protein